MEQAKDITNPRFRKARGKWETKPTEIITCTYCKGVFKVEKSYGTWHKGKRIIPKHRFCCRDHHWKWHAKYGKRAVAAKGSRSCSWKEIDKTKLEEMIQQGKQHKEIAKIMGVHKCTISKRVKLYKIKRFSPELVAKIRKEFLEKGTPYTKLGEKYGIGIIRMREILKGLNYRANTKQGYTFEVTPDKKVKEMFRKKGFKIIECGNMCLDYKRKCLPLDICQRCPIKKGKVEIMNFFDIIMEKDNKFYLVEVKSKSDTFSWNQTSNLLQLSKQGINICIVRCYKNDMKIIMM